MLLRHEIQNLKGCAPAADPLSPHGSLKRLCWYELGTFIGPSTSNCSRYLRALCVCAIYVRAIYVRAMCVQSMRVLSMCVQDMYEQCVRAICVRAICLRACAVRAMCVLCACYARAMCVGVLCARSVRASHAIACFPSVFSMIESYPHPNAVFKVTYVKGTQPGSSQLPTLRFHYIRENRDLCHVRISKKGMLMGNLDGVT